MNRTTIMLPPELKRRALARADARGISLAELIRQCLEAEVREARERPAEDPLFADRVVYQGETPADLARRHDDYLYD